jgi:hypothetical protein
MTRLATALLLLLTTAGCDASMGLPSDSSWADNQTADQDAGMDDLADEQDAPADDNEAPADDEDEDTFVPPFPTDDEDEDVDVCVFGDWTGGWTDDESLDPTEFDHITHPDMLTDLELDQLEVGFDRWDFFDFNTLDDFFWMLEGGRVLSRDVVALDLDRSFTHLRMHFRGMEFGFVFVAGTDRAVAAIVDGEVLDCSVTM